MPNAEIDPADLHAGYIRVNNRARCTHTYYAALSGFGVIFRAKKQIRTATEAQKYADRLLARWCRLYHAATKEATWTKRRSSPSSTGH